MTFPNKNTAIQLSLTSIHIWKSYSKKSKDLMEHGVKLSPSYCSS